ncbi:MAG TPA: formylglycine-generating enzyme family protein, partial [Sedimentisphaerales bacterium]|nr:formylglycine-generating enzyme family protein [Sedimentisphaerales bacterium]
EYVPSTIGRSKQAGTAKAASGEKQVTNSIGMKLTLIQAGEFMMGSGESAEATAAFFNKYYGLGPKNKYYVEVTGDRFQDEHPQHLVRITKPFYLGTYHVTRGQFRQFLKDSGYKTDAETGDKQKRPPGDHSWQKPGFEQTDEHPVVNVSWYDAVAFCEWLSKKEGKTYRLPTQAEFEYACRAGTKTRYYSGDDPETLAKVGNVDDAARGWGSIKASDGYVYTSPVGSFKPNAFGLYDMHGNAWQWCADWYGEDKDYYTKSPTDDPTGPDTGRRRVLGGGSWATRAMYGRSSECHMRTPDYRFNSMGFRVARTK